MSFASDLAGEIWAEGAFRVDLVQLETANIRAELGECGLIERAEAIDVEILKRLLQAAMVFADTDDDRYQAAAQRISTATLRLAGSAVSGLFAMIQGRLRNFVAIRSMNPHTLPPRDAPISLLYEFVERRFRQTIITGDDTEHVLTPFQLHSWKILADGRSGALSGPTSAGKSYVLVLHLVERFRAGVVQTAAYVVPTRALINQVSGDVTTALAQHDVRDVIVTSVPVDLSPGGAAKLLYVVTQERLDALLIANPNLNLDLVVVDEAQMIANGSRGVLLESVMDRISAGQEKSQFVFSGPLIENPSYFGEIFELRNFATSISKRSPVTQNIIFLDYVDLPVPKVSVKVLVEPDGAAQVATIDLPGRLITDRDRLSRLSSLFGRSGSSIVYAGGKSDAEKIAAKIAIDLQHIDPCVNTPSELINFVKRHVHKDYALAATLEKGVGFHYGHMPSLLRKQLEDHFRERKIQYLVCTSTLLYGLNLPARNIFLSKPTTGRGRAISGTDFWNLSGRAGRMGKELEGNVFLIDYDRWGTRPLAEKRGLSVASALKTTIVDQAEGLLAFLNNPSISSDAHPDLEVTLGKLVLDERVGRLARTLRRYASSAQPQTLGAIRDRVEQISMTVEIPTEVLNANVGVSIFRQIDLLNYMMRRLKQLPPEELIPAHPLGEFHDVLNNHRRAFKRIHTHLLKYNSSDQRHNFFAPLALRWMRGDPLPALIDASIRYHRSKSTGKSLSAIIRETMENVEENLRFRYVKYFTCYNSLLKVAFERAGNAAYAQSIPDIPLFLEVGGSSGAMINLMALGLSRTSAESIVEYVTEKEMTIQDLQNWLRKVDLTALDISPACAREIQAVVATVSTYTGG